MQRGICKFISDPQPETLKTHCFIYESDHAVMEKSVVLPYHRAILIRQGSGRFSFSGVEVPFFAGHLIFGFAGETFQVPEHSPDCEYMYIYFEGQRANRLLQRFSVHKYNRAFQNFDGAVPYWFYSLTRAADDNIDLAAESMLLYAFSILSSTSKEQNDLIFKMTKLTEHHFSDQSLTLSTLAEELSYNAKYLSHLFKKKMGIGYTEYLRTVRLKYAVTLLEHGVDSVKNVALLSGFTDPLYFSNVFKSTFGMSPKEYQKKNLKKDEENRA